MNYVDLVLMMMLFLAFAFGWKFRGVYLVIIPVAFFSGLLVANLLYGHISSMLAESIANDTKRMLFSYTLVFFFTSSIVVGLGITFARFFDFFSLTFIDRLLGAVILLSIITIPFYFILALFTSFFHSAGLASAVSKSVIFPYVEKYAMFLIKLPVMEHLSVIDKIIK